MTLYATLCLRWLSFAGLHGYLQATVVIFEGSETTLGGGFVFHRSIFIDVVKRR